MPSALPFPYGRFTEAEWYAAFALSLSAEDAAREAAFHAHLDPRVTPQVSVEPSLLAFLALVSPALAARVDAYRREVAGARGAPDIASADEEAWRVLLDTLGWHFGGADGRGSGEAW